MVIETEIVIKLLLSAGLGLLIGLEREVTRKPAGMRTHAIVSFGACLFVLGGLSLGGPDFVSRVIPGIITGVGFLGAGIIFQAENRVRGLTTAAEIWTLSAIGILVGLGEYTISIASAIIMLLILVPFKWVEKQLDR